jgi:hypothetical protein
LDLEDFGETMDEVETAMAAISGGATAEQVESRVCEADAAVLAGDLTSGVDMAQLMDARRQRQRRDG